MHVVIDNQNEGRPEVKALVIYREEAVEMAMTLEAKTRMGGASAFDVDLFKRAMALCGQNGYIRIGPFCVQDLGA